MLSFFVCFYEEHSDLGLLLSWFFQNQGTLNFFLQDLFASLPALWKMWAVFPRVSSWAMCMVSKSTWEMDRWLWNLRPRPFDGLGWTRTYWREGIGPALPFATATSLGRCSCLELDSDQRLFLSGHFSAGHGTDSKYLGQSLKQVAPTG